MGSLFLQNRRKAILLMPLFVLSVNAQHVLTKEYHAPRAGDRLIKQQMEYTGSGEDGDSVCWDFSNVEIKEEEENWPVDYSALPDSLFAKIENHTRFVYNDFSDSLLLKSNENRLLRMDYGNPVLEMVFPLSYGDAFSSTFHGTGVYSQKYVLATQGGSESRIDAFGTIILPTKDTLSQVTRLYTLKNAYISISSDSAEANVISGQHIVSEHYQWYARGYRYPVYEVSATTFYKGARPASIQHTAFCFAPSDQRLLPDTLNENLAREDSIIRRDMRQHDVIRYEVKRHGNQLTLTYSLKDQANVKAVIADAMGIIYRQNQQTHPAGEDYSISLDCSGLKPGKYVLYIRVNETVYYEKIVI